MLSSDWSKSMFTYRYRKFTPEKLEITGKIVIFRNFAILTLSLNHRSSACLARQ